MTAEAAQHDLSITLEDGMTPASPSRRQTTPSNALCPRGITSLTVSYPEQYATGSSNKSPPPSRWLTPEYVFYLLGLAQLVWVWFRIPIRLSSGAHPNFPRYEAWLSSGWMGRRMYKQFRAGLLPLTGLALVYLAASKASVRVCSRMRFLLVVSLVINVLLHGFSSAKVLAILLLNYTLARSLAGKRGFVLLIWAVNVALLFANEIYDGYRYATLFDVLAPLDGWKGLLPRWHILYNFSMLRIVSFCVDLHWARSPPSSRDGRLRSHRPEEYSLQAFLAYVLYPPLYIAGPIMPFDDFYAQITKEPPALQRGDIARYAVRLGVCLLTMEWTLHHVYVGAIKNAEAWDGDTPSELAMIGFWNLVVIWLKLLIPWRFFRLWALLDGVDPPENMVRCVANNYSTMAFWRSWHRSYNRWIIRYLYAPLGGSLWSRLLIFTFVAVWHDLRLHLLIWGWAIFLFLLPEWLASRWLPESTYGHHWWYHHAVAFGGALNVIMMITANLIGFALGYDGALYLFQQIFSGWKGLQFTAACVGHLFLLVQLMREYRNEELRHGIQQVVKALFNIASFGSEARWMVVPACKSCRRALRENAPRGQNRLHAVMVRQLIGVCLRSGRQPDGHENVAERSHVALL